MRKSKVFQKKSKLLKIRSQKHLTSMSSIEAGSIISNRKINSSQRKFRIESTRKKKTLSKRGLDNIAKSIHRICSSKSMKIEKSNIWIKSKELLKLDIWVWCIWHKVTECWSCWSREDIFFYSSLWAFKYESNMSMLIGIKEFSIAYFFMSENPLLSKHISSAFHIASFHIIRIWKQSKRYKKYNNWYNNHEFYKSKSRWWGFVLQHKWTTFRFLFSSELNSSNRNHLHNSWKNRYSKPHDKNTCSEKRNWLDKLDHNSKWTIDFTAVLFSYFECRYIDRWCSLGTFDHLKDITREYYMIGVTWFESFRNLLSSGNLTRNLLKHKNNNSISWTWSCQFKRSQNTNPRWHKKSKCIHDLNNHIVFVHFSYNWKFDLSGINPSPSRWGTHIRVENKKPSNKESYNIENIILHKIRYEDKWLCRPWNICCHLSNHWHNLRNHIDHNNDDGKNEKGKYNKRICKCSIYLSSQILLHSHFSRNSSKCLTHHACLFSRLDDRNLFFSIKKWNFSHGNIHCISTLKKENCILNNVMVSPWFKSIEKSLQRG